MKQWAQNLRMKIRIAELYLKGVTVIYALQLLAARLLELASKLERLVAPTGSTPTIREIITANFLLITCQLNDEINFARFTLPRWPEIINKQINNYCCLLQLLVWVSGVQRGGKKGQAESAPTYYSNRHLNWTTSSPTAPSLNAPHRLATWMSTAELDIFCEASLEKKLCHAYITMKHWYILNAMSCVIEFAPENLSGPVTF